MSANLRRLIVCLDVDGGRVKKGVRFEGLRDVGDPVELALRYEAAGADEIVFLDITATVDDRAQMREVVHRTAEQLFIPLTVGGGVRSLEDFERSLAAGADKIAVNTAAIADPSLLSRARDRFGAQCVVLSIDAVRVTQPDGAASYRVATHGGRRLTDVDAIEWAKRGVELGAGEILLTSVDADGARTGYELELTRRVADAVKVPVVASGGAGNSLHIVEAIRAGADAALVAGILHDGTTTVRALKEQARAAGIPMREVEA
ncbi:MAG: imidazole glycerol phosphate synthase subunit HisF [Polyangiaceae bacterium]